MKKVIVFIVFLIALIIITVFFHKKLLQQDLTPIQQPVLREPNSTGRLVISPSSLVPLTICEALLKATQAVDVNDDDLGPATKEQEVFIDKQYVTYIKKNMREKFTAQELFSHASHDYKVLNEILAQKGFSIQFPQFDLKDIGILAIQDILVRWLQEGATTVVVSEGKEYPGVILKEAHFFADAQRSVIIVALETQSEDTVYLVTKRDGELFAQEPTVVMIADACTQYHHMLGSGAYEKVEDVFEAVHFPMVYYQTRPEVSWLKEMRVGGMAKIAQAMQEIIFTMNEQGARAKVATGLLIEMMTAPNDQQKVPLIIDKPFLVWIERSGVALPIFVGYMTTEYWKQPEKL